MNSHKIAVAFIGLIAISFMISTEINNNQTLNVDIPNVGKATSTAVRMFDTSLMFPSKDLSINQGERVQVTVLPLNLGEETVTEAGASYSADGKKFSEINTYPIPNTLRFVQFGWDTTNLPSGPGSLKTYVKTSGGDVAENEVSVDIANDGVEGSTDKVAACSPTVSGNSGQNEYDYCSCERMYIEERGESPRDIKGISSRGLDNPQLLGPLPPAGQSRPAGIARNRITGESSSMYLVGNAFMIKAQMLGTNTNCKTGQKVASKVEISDGGRRRILYNTNRVNQHTNNPFLGFDPDRVTDFTNPSLYGFDNYGERSGSVHKGGPLPPYASACSYNWYDQPSDPVKKGEHVKSVRKYMAYVKGVGPNPPPNLPKSCYCYWEVHMETNAKGKVLKNELTGPGGYGSPQCTVK